MPWKTFFKPLFCIVYPVWVQVLKKYKKRKKTTDFCPLKRGGWGVGSELRGHEKTIMFYWPLPSAGPWLISRDKINLTIRLDVLWLFHIYFCRCWNDSTGKDTSLIIRRHVCRVRSYMNSWILICMLVHILVMTCRGPWVWSRSSTAVQCPLHFMIYLIRIRRSIQYHEY